MENNWAYFSLVLSAYISEMWALEKVAVVFSSPLTTGEQLNLASVNLKKSATNLIALQIFTKAFVHILGKGPFCSCFND